MGNDESNTNGSLVESARPFQDKKGKKRKVKNKVSTQESKNVGEPREKILKVTEEDNEFRCSICTELFIGAVTLTCSHTFCKYCIDNWRRKCTHAKCPICRANIDREVPNRIVDHLILKEIDKCSKKERERRIKMLEERTIEATSNAKNKRKKRRRRKRKTTGNLRIA